VPQGLSLESGVRIQLHSIFVQTPVDVKIIESAQIFPSKLFVKRERLFGRRIRLAEIEESLLLNAEIMAEAIKAICG
jgi:hypothetical protein